VEKEDDDEEEEDPVAHPDTHPSPVTGYLEEHRIRVGGFCYFFVLISMD
jgi:hypothetical protein